MKSISENGADPDQQPQALLADSTRLFSRRQIEQALDQCAVKLQLEMSSELKSGVGLCAIVVAKGGMLPATWLLQRLPLPLKLDYVHASRYHGGTEGRQLHWLRQPEIDLSNFCVLLIDDIFDAGYTLQAVQEWCLEQGASRVITVALINKLHQRGLSRDWLDYAVLEAPDQYLFGCGMDIYEHWRHLPDIYAWQGRTNSQ